METINLTDAELDGLSDDPYRAFLEADQILRQKVSKQSSFSGVVRNAGGGSQKAVPKRVVSNATPLAVLKVSTEAMLQHLAQLEALASALDIDTGLRYEIYKSEDGSLGDSYAERIRELDALSLKYRFGLRRSSSSLGALRVSFEDDERDEVHRYIAKIRKVISAADLPPRRGDVLFDRLNALAKEVDRSMTRIDAFAAVALDFTGAIGQAAENLEPVVKLIERVGAVFSKAKARQDTPELEAPGEKLQITDQTESDDESA